MSNFPVAVSRNGFNITRFDKPINMAAKFSSAKELLHRMPRWMGELAVGHAMANFKVEGFIDKGGVQRWPKKKRPNGKKTLVDTGFMKRTTKVVFADRSQAKVSTAAPYAGIHNRPVGQRRKYETGSYPGRKFLGHSQELAKVTAQMIVSRLNKAMAK